jgi:hypothetical protein
MKMKAISLKRNLVVGVITLFVGMLVAPSVMGDICFFDDFNDNIKDYDKWTEIYTDGTWEEVNQRTEFQLYETGVSGEADYEGIESSEFTVSLSSSVPVIISWDEITNIGSTGSVGSIFFEVTDGTNWIRTEYYRWWDDTKFMDNNDGGYTILNQPKLDGSWSNEIRIYSDRYCVRMDTDSSGWVYDQIFSSNPTLKIRMYLGIGGLQPSLFTRSGFDNVLVEWTPAGAIPTLTEWGLIIFGVVLLGFITWVFLKRRKAVAGFTAD